MGFHVVEYAVSEGLTHHPTVVYDLWIHAGNCDKGLRISKG